MSPTAAWALCTAAQLALWLGWAHRCRAARAEAAAEALACAHEATRMLLRDMAETFEATAREAEREPVGTCMEELADRFRAEGYAAGLAWGMSCAATSCRDIADLVSMDSGLAELADAPA